MERAKLFPWGTGTFWVEGGTSFLLLSQLPFLLGPGTGVCWVSRGWEFPTHPPPERRSQWGPCPKHPSSGLQFPAGEKSDREQAWSRLWRAAFPRAHDLSQPGAKPCHESGPGGR